MRRMALPLLLVSAAAQAQVTPERELDVVRSMFNAGNYKLALERAQDAMAMANFSDLQRVELHKFAGVSAFNLGEAATAERHFMQLLQINPDFVLDPFAVPPPAIKLFEEVKKKNADALNLIRQNIALREEQARRDAAEVARRKQVDEAERDRLAALSANRQVKTVEKRSWFLNLIPFGFGQFIQGRYDWGVAFLVVELVAGVTSLISYIYIETLFQDVPMVQPDSWDPKTQTFGPHQYTVRAIPAARTNDHTNWEYVKYTSAVVFYAVAAAGIIEAFWHHRGEVVTVTTEPVQGPTMHLNLAPIPGGLSGGIRIEF
jgi:tetratricopeptide (TPR) repeat protein